MELTIVRNNHVAEISNFNAYKETLVTEMSKYKGYLPATEVDAKNDRANLNKLKKAIDDKRKEVKNQIMAEYSVLETQCKELTGIIDEAINEVDTCVKQAEEKYIAEKTEDVKKTWEDLGYQLVSLDQVFSQKWLNKTCSLKDVRAEMVVIIDGINANLAVLESLNPILKPDYLATLDLQGTINQYNARREAEAKLKEVQQESPVEESPVEEKPSEPRSSVTLKVYATKTNLKELGKWLRNNGYEFEQLSDVEIEEK